MRTGIEVCSPPFPNPNSFRFETVMSGHVQPEQFQKNHVITVLSSKIYDSNPD